MADDTSKLVSIKRYLRRKFSAAEIKQLADKAFTDVAAGVTVTNVGFEGGNTGAQITCEPSILLQACEDILVDLGDPDAVAPPSKVVFSDYSGTCIET